jgi:hypothetical protein
LRRSRLPARRRGGCPSRTGSASNEAASGRFAIAVDRSIVRATLTIRSTVRSHRTIVIGRQTLRAARAGRLAVSIPLTRSGRSAVMRRRKVAATLRISVTPPSGRVTTLTRRLTLLR